MPNYSIIGDVTRSNFDPSEFTALESHGKAMTDQYNAMMTAYGEMQSKASMYEKLANDVKGKDSVAYQNYMNYANALRQHTDLLATQGLTPSTLRNLVQAQSDYQRIVHPIEEAYNARERLAKEQADYLKEHPSAVFERDASNIGIDQMMRLGPSYRAKSVDKEKVAERAKERFSALQKQLMDIVSQAGKDGLDLKDSRQVRTWVKTKAPWLWETMEKYGANPEDVNRLLAGDPSMEDSMLNRIVQDTYRMYGVDSWNTDYDHFSDEQNAQNRLNKMDELYTSVRGEAPNAIGTAKFSDYKNDLDAQILMNRERIAAQERMAKAQRDWEDKKAGEGDKTQREDWYINRTSNYNNPDAQTSEANFLRQMYKFAANSGLQDKSANYIEFLLDKVGIDRKAIESGSVDINNPEVINAIKKLNESGKYSEKDANYFGAKQAGQELAAVGEVLAYIGGGAVNAALITTPLGWGMAATGWGRKLREDANYRAKISKLYEQARAGSKTAVEELKKEGILETGLSYEQKLKKLIDYQNDDAYDLDEQADMYIRGSATNLSGATSNWAGTSQKHAGQVIYTLLNQAISKKDDAEVYDYLRDTKDRSKKIDIAKFKSVAGVNDNGEMTNLPQVGVNFDKNGKLKVTLEFNASKDNDATAYEFDDRLITNGSAERQKYKATMEDAQRNMKQASKFTKQETDILHNEAIKIYNALPAKDRESKTETDVFKELRQRMIYKRKLLAQSQFNEAKGNFFLSLGINTHDVNTRTKGSAEQILTEVRRDPSFNDMLTAESENFGF